MHKHPVPNIPGGAPPRIEKRKNMLPQQQSIAVQALSLEYLRKRNRAIELKNKAQEVELALRRSTLVEKQLVERQASYLLVNLRQKLLNLGSHARINSPALKSTTLARS